MALFTTAAATAAAAEAAATTSAVVGGESAFLSASTIAGANAAAGLVGPAAGGSAFSLASIGTALKGTLPYLQTAGFGISALGSIQQGRAAKQSADYQAGILHQQADRERQVGDANASDFLVRESRVMASRRALLSASGVESGEGSPLAVSQDFAGDTELQALRIRDNAAVSASRLDESAALQQQAGRNALAAGYGRSGALLLTGLGQTYGDDGRSIRMRN